MTDIDPANPAHAAACDDLEDDVLAGSVSVRRVFSRDGRSSRYEVRIRPGRGH